MDTLDPGAACLVPSRGVRALGAASVSVEVFGAGFSVGAPNAPAGAVFASCAAAHAQRAADFLAALQPAEQEGREAA